MDSAVKTSHLLSAAAELAAEAAMHFEIAEELQHDGDTVRLDEVIDERLEGVKLLEAMQTLLELVDHSSLRVLRWERNATIRLQEELEKRDTKVWGEDDE